MPVTNHIARDFQLTLCSALGARVVKDVYLGCWVTEKPSMTTDWPVEQGLAACEQGLQQSRVHSG